MFNSYGHPIVSNCIFRYNSATQGAGIYNNHSNPKFQFCHFTQNIAKYGDSSGCGGGMYNKLSIPIISGCVFHNNTGVSCGGGIHNTDSDVTLNNCSFIGNTAETGGGIYNQGSNITTINCRVLGNSAKYGGGLCDDSDSISTIIQSVFSGNSATRWAGAILGARAAIKHSIICYNTAEQNVGGAYCVDGVISNSVIWGNSELSIVNEFTQIHGANFEINYCCIQGWSGLFKGTGNFDADPKFIDADGADDIVGTEDDDVRFSIYSPCIDSGNTDYMAEDVVDLDNDGDYSESIPVDMGGSLRVKDIAWIPNTGAGFLAGLDVGPYEVTSSPAFIIDKKEITLPEGTQDTFTVALILDPGGVVNVDITNIAGDDDIVILNGKTLIFDSSNYMNPQIVTLMALEDGDNLDNQSIISVTSPGYGSYELAVNEVDDEDALLIYVDTEATGVNDGSDWTNAFIHLQDALTLARTMGQKAEIRVAQGIYCPDLGVGYTPGDRNSSFELINRVTIEGGYIGNAGLDPNEKNTYRYQTILSGDLNGDDGPGFNNFSENSYHVLTGTNIDSSSICNDVIISHGNADASFNGGGVYLISSNPIFKSCIICNNMTDKKGGGVYIVSGQPTFNYCRFVENKSVESGGAVITYSCNTTFENCYFYNNESTDYYAGGGGISATKGFLHLKNCHFYCNKARGSSGAVGSEDSDNIIENCTFVKNNAYGMGGGLNIGGNVCNLSMKNCWFEENYALDHGGGSVLGAGLNGICDLQNCVFIRNLGSKGGGLSCQSLPACLKNCVFHANSAIDYGGGMDAGNCNATINNCIFWENSSPNGPEIAFRQIAWPAGPFELEISYSDIQNGPASIFTTAGCSVIWGARNISQNPEFTANYHLKQSSVCINSGDPAYIATENDLDIDNEERVYDGQIDIGADEFIDSENDGMPDFWESMFELNTLVDDSTLDHDEDGLSNIIEYMNSTNPLDQDTDHDTIPDKWEVDHNINPLLDDALDDYDNDNLKNIDEYLRNCEPRNPDTDEDNLSDGEEVNIYSTSPTNPDSDYDTLPDSWEVINELNPLDESDKEIDSDGDNLINVDEYLYGCSANNVDTEGDGMWDGWEIRYSFNPLQNDAEDDADGDGYANIDEFLRNTLPRDPNSTPEIVPLYVDDNAPNDPGPNDPMISDPDENGTVQHPFDAIQEAIDVAIRRDRIIVKTGNYYENIQFLGKYITLTSLNPDDAVIVDSTIISGDHANTTITFTGTESPDCLLTGLTITGGFSSSTGGGIRGNNTNATVSQCLITDNQAQLGGGIHGINGKIDRCVFTNNTATSRGAAIADSPGTITNCLITNNIVSGGYGTIYNCDGHITHCTVASNTGYGISNSNGTITNCIIWNNSAGQLNNSSGTTYSCVQNGGTSNGNIKSNPMFISANNYHLN